MTKFLIALAAVFNAHYALAAGGAFYCATAPGNQPFDGNYVSGELDGEAEVSQLVVNYAEGDGIETDLRIESIDLEDKFELVANDFLREDPIKITVQAPKNNGKSDATFKFEYAEVTVSRTGTCRVSFTRGK